MKCTLCVVGIIITETCVDIPQWGEQVFSGFVPKKI